MSPPTLVIPVVFPDPALHPVNAVDLKGLNRFDIVLSGYWELDETQSTANAREAHETEADAVLYDMAAAFSRAGASTEIRLHFGPTGEAGRDHLTTVVEATDADGIMQADQFSSLLNILIPLRDVRHQQEILEFVSQLDPDSIFVVELYHVAADEDAAVTAEEMLRTVEETLLGRGFTESDIERTVAVADDASTALADCARDHHLVVMGETERPDADDQFFGPVSQDIATEAETPIIVVLE